MDQQPTTNFCDANLSPKPQGDVADVSDFVRLTGPAAFQPADSQAVSENQRVGQRRHYPFRQRIAPILNGAMPSEEQFSEVPFSDISAAGASFLWEGELGFDRLVIELGSGSNVSHVIAQVAWVERLEPVQPGCCTLRVGCQMDCGCQLSR